MPTGRAITAPMATDSAEIWMCSTSRWGIPSGPFQCAGSANHRTTLEICVIRWCLATRGWRSAARRSARGRPPMPVRSKDGPDDERCMEVLNQAFVDQLAQPAEADQRGDRDG